jgi:pyruvate formate lyase activating enzyme
MKNSGVVFNIQKYSVHDGPGIRTVVFLKGCPLRCRWCSNPESQTPHPQVAYNKNKCLTLEKCVRCTEICSAGAIKSGTDNRVEIDHDVCTECLLCTEACPSLALIHYGDTMSVAQIINKVEEDGMFYARSGGGLTLSGGEPMHQAEFAVGILREAKRRRINTAMETCGFCRWEDLAATGGYLDTLLYDIKIMDPDKHQQFTGVSNDLILDNFKRMRAAFPELPIWVRTPIVPGFNDSEADIRPILEHIRDLPHVFYEPLPYHRMGSPKYEYIGRDYGIPADAKLSDDIMPRINRLIQSEFSHLRSPETPENAKVQNAAPHP